jgi:hypothetical protein
MVFRAVPFSRRPKKAGSSSSQLGSPPEFVASASGRSLEHPGAIRGVWFLVAASIVRVHLPASVPGSPTFRPQRFARSRRFAPRRILQICFALLPRPGFPLRGYTPDLAAPPRRWPVPSRRWRRVSVVGCPTTPSRVASTSVPCSRSGSGARPRGVSPRSCPCPVAFVSFGLSLPTLPWR